MSEKLLRAIIQLFAMVAKEDGVKEVERKNIEEFLKENLNAESVGYYMDLLDHYIFGLQEQFQNLPGVDHDTADFLDDWSKVMQSAEYINKELTRQQKLVLIMKMIELILADGAMSERETNLVYYIGETIKIEQEDITLIHDFVSWRSVSQITGDNVLVIHDSEIHLKPGLVKHLPLDFLIGELIILRMPETETYFVKYLGPSLLYLNGIPLRQGRSAIFSTGSTIRGPKIQPIYYSDVVSQFLSVHSENKISF